MVHIKDYERRVEIAKKRSLQEAHKYIEKEGWQIIGEGITLNNNLIIWVKQEV